MRRRALLASLAGLTAACASVDQISFDRGRFAITFTKWATICKQLLGAAIEKHTKAGVPDAYGLKLQKYLDEITELQVAVEKAIAEAPEKARAMNEEGLGRGVAILEKAIPLILPLLAV